MFRFDWGFTFNWTYQVYAWAGRYARNMCAMTRWAYETNWDVAVTVIQCCETVWLQKDWMETAVFVTFPPQLFNHTKSNTQPKLCGTNRKWEKIVNTQTWRGNSISVWHLYANIVIALAFSFSDYRCSFPWWRRWQRNAVRIKCKYTCMSTNIHTWH